MDTGSSPLSTHTMDWGAVLDQHGAHGYSTPMSVPGSGRSPGGHGNPPQYSCLENPMDRGTQWAVIHQATELNTPEATKHESTRV